MKKIVVLDAHTANPGDLSWAALETLGACEIHPRTPREETVARCAGAQVVLTNKAPLTREMIDALPDLRYVGVMATGYNIVDVAAAEARGIVVTNVPGYSTPGVAQLVFALILEMTNHVGHAAQTVRDGAWVRCPDFSYWDHPIQELSGRTLGVIGFGEIGSAVARIGLAFGMRVLASKRTWNPAPPPGVEPATVEEVFRQADFISLHCPLTEDTRHLVSDRTLALMKPEGRIVNTGRGPLVDEAALARALNAGRIAGAALDVLSLEPPSADNPLLQARNCLITPHVGWAGYESRARLIAQVVSNLRAFLEGHPVNVVRSGA
ncbi:MAG: hypothetical protein RLZZ142_421 [Verrucomicrobiota bacterium]